MAIPSFTRYQSRILNGIFRSSQKLTEKGDRIFRHIKVAVTWGIEILLYPIYAFFQVSLLVKQELQAAKNKSEKQLQPNDDREYPKLPAVDKAIDEVLQLAENFSSLNFLPSPKITTNLPSTEKNTKEITINGIATLLNNRNLVLVTKNNQIFDIFNHDQQQKIHQKIFTELANYWRQRKNLAVDLDVAKEKSIIPPINPNLTPIDRSTVDKDMMALPLRLFWEIMTWMEKGNLARKVNLFGEATLVLQSPEYITNIDFANSHFDMNFDWQENQQIRIYALIHAAVNYFFNKNYDNQLQRDEISVNYDNITDNLTDNLPDNLTYNISPATPAKSLVAENVSISDKKTEKNDIDVWLTMGDLFGAKSIEEKNQTSGNIKPIINSNIPNTPNTPTGKTEDITGENISNNSQDIPEITGNKSREKITQFLLKPIEILTPKKKSIGNQGIIQKVGNVVKKNKITGKENNSRVSPVTPGVAIASEKNLVGENREEIEIINSSLENIPVSSMQTADNINVSGMGSLIEDKNICNSPGEDFIETQATAIGYEKHYLEIILDWLDRGMLWLENVIIRIWDTIREYLAKLQNRPK